MSFSFRLLGIWRLTFKILFSSDSVLSYLYIFLISSVLFSFAEYCGTFCYPNVAQSPYLRTVGEKLLPGIDVLWTGEVEFFFFKYSVGVPSYLS